MAQSDNERRNSTNTLLTVLIVQVGVLTLGIILLSLFAGLWLDRTFETKPLFTLILLLAGTPVSVLVMLGVARRTLARIKAGSGQKDKDSTK